MWKFGLNCANNWIGRHSKILQFGQSTAIWVASLKLFVICNPSKHWRFFELVWCITATLKFNCYVQLCYLVGRTIHLNFDELRQILNLYRFVDTMPYCKTQPPASIAQWRKQGIREIKVCKKCPKVNPYCDAICDPILIKPFLDGAKWPKFCAKYFSL